ncbi:MAG: DUF1249 domain-containing protein, partial [Litorivicinus sp.]
LAAQQAESSGNYLLLKRLLTLLDGPASGVFGVPEQGRILVTETERAAYTSFITLAPLDRSEWLQVPQLDVRMYHDARMAEVASINGFRPIKGSHRAASDHGLHIDEKQQINQHLGEWLRYCLAQGLAVMPNQARP